MPGTLHVPMPAELAEIIATHRALFGGFVMEAEVGGADTDASATTTAGASTSTTTAPDWDGKVESLPAGVQDLIKGLRTENAQKRTAAKTAEDTANAKITAALKALGIDTDQKDPVKAAQDEAAARASERDAERRARVLSDAELIVWRNAAALGVNAASLTDSRAFERAISNLDPSAADFADKVKDAAKKAADTNPMLKAAQAAARGGAEFSGGTGERAKKPASLEAAVSAAYSA